MHDIMDRGQNFTFRRAEGPGREIWKRPVHPSVTFRFRTETKKCIALFPRNFAGMCTMLWGMLYSF